MFVADYFLNAKSVETLFYSQFKTLLKNNQLGDIVIREKYITGWSSRRQSEIFLRRNESTN